MSASPTLRTLFGESLKIGCLGFGGPAGQIALMHRIVVDERRWIDEGRFQQMLAFCMLLPGPEAQQLATYIGWRLRGVRGALIAGWLFVLPGALMVLALSALYVRFGNAPLVAAAFDGIKAAVVALVVEALLRVGKRALQTRAAALIAIASFAALLLGALFPLVIVTAAILGALFLSGDGQIPTPSARVRKGGAAALVWLGLWLSPIAALAIAFGPGHILVEIAVLFSVLACVTFGGAYAVLAYLAVEAERRGWLTTSQMIDGLGLAETTPGPLILVNEFVGYLAGWGAGGVGLALAGAALAVWCTFAPSFVWIFAAAPIAERVQDNPRARGALSAVTAAVLGVIASLAFFFASHALFERRVEIGLASAPDVTSVRPWMAALAIAAGAALIHFRVNLLAVLGACALVGLAARAAGL